MRNPFQRLLLFILLITSLNLFAQSPSTPIEKNTDSVLQRSFRLINNKNLDELLSLFSEDFKKRVPTLKSFMQDQVMTQAPFYNITYKKNNNGVINYQVKTKTNL